MTPVDAYVSGAISLRDIGFKAQDRIRYALNYPNPAYGAQFVLKNRPKADVPEWLSAMEEFPDGTVRVPRGCVKELRAALAECDMEPRWVDLRSEGDPIRPEQVELRDYQEAAVREMVSKQQGMVLMPCGSGKTRAGIAAIGRVARTTLVVVPTKDLLSQWAQSIEDLLWMTPGLVGDGQEEWKPITIAIVDTLAALVRARGADGPWAQFGVCIVDEAHRSPGPATYQVALPSIPAKYRLGLTATERDDALNKIMHWSFGRKLCDVDTHYLVKRGFLTACKIEEVETDFEFEYEGPDKKKLHALRRAIVNDTARTELVARKAVENWRDGETVLVLANDQVLCKKLAAAMVEMGAPAAVLVGSNQRKRKKGSPVAPELAEGVVRRTRKQRTRTLSAMRAGEERLVVATSIADEGLDLPILSRVHLAWPGASKRIVKQQIGRAMRPREGKYPVLYDYVDINVDTLKRRRGDRRRAFRELGLM